MDRNDTSDQLGETAIERQAQSIALPRELRRPYNVQEILRSDAVAPPRTLLEASDFDLGTGPINIERYVSRDFHDREVERMWSRVWQFAAWAHDLPNPGDTAVYRNVDQSVVIVRQHDGSLKAFVNSCLHRGREICNADGRRVQLRCPYHGFTWSLAGELKWTPCEWDFPQVKAETFSLPQVRVAEWNGFVFINMSDEAPSLKEYMGSMVQQWEGWDFNSRYKAVHVEKLLNCNWKVCMEAFLEGMHVYATHPELAFFLPETSTQYDIYPDEPHFSRFHGLAGQASSNLKEQPSEQEILDSFLSTFFKDVFGTEMGKLRAGENARAGMGRVIRHVHKTNFGTDMSEAPNSTLIDSTEYFLFPNFMPWPSLNTPIVYRFRPGDGPDWCIFETMLFLPFTGERPPSGKVIKLGPDASMADVKELGALNHILQQDADQLPLVQRGLKASRTRVVTLTKYQENRIRHYNRTLDSYVND